MRKISAKCANVEQIEPWRIRLLGLNYVWARAIDSKMYSLIQFKHLGNTMLIPKQWRDTVRGILESCDASRIVVTVRAKRDLEVAFPLAV